nr:MAG TPA: hypothetical protein [Caudoviricetes sp.]
MPEGSTTRMTLPASSTKEIACGVQLMMLLIVYFFLQIRVTGHYRKVENHFHLSVNRTRLDMLDVAHDLVPFALIVDLEVSLTPSVSVAVPHFPATAPDSGFFGTRETEVVIEITTDKVILPCRGVPALGLPVVVQLVPVVGVRVVRGRPVIYSLSLNVPGLFGLGPLVLDQLMNQELVGDQPVPNIAIHIVCGAIVEDTLVLIVIARERANVAVDIINDLVHNNSASTLALDGKCSRLLIVGIAHVTGIAPEAHGLKKLMSIFLHLLFLHDNSLLFSWKRKIEGLNQSSANTVGSALYIALASSSNWSMVASSKNATITSTRAHSCAVAML